MRYLAVLGALWLAAAFCPAQAQLHVSAQTTRSAFLLYENVDIIVTINNIGETDILLSNNEGQPWLSFVVARRSQNNYVPVRPERDSAFKGMTIKAGETKTLRVNITPLFAFRDEGEYRAAAVIDLPGQGQILSDNVPFTILEGRKIWTQTHSFDSTQRVYSLIRFSRTPTTTNLYLRIEEPDSNLVNANLSLGELVSMIDPEVFFDPAGNLHVLNPCALGTYRYTRLDPDGNIERQSIFKSADHVPPRLRKLEDGNVIVYGGFEENPNTPREKLSNGQVAQKNTPPSDSVQ